MIDKKLFSVIDLIKFEYEFPIVTNFLQQYHNGKIKTVSFNFVDCIYHILFDNFEETYLGILLVIHIETRRYMYDELSILYSDYMKGYKVVEDE
ncbi:MAG: hypothetical protein RBQ97_10855 [Acholeplasma sp.]|nr:hypothetical protein [Acholeplasma sp.]